MTKRLTNEEKLLMEPCAIGIGNDMEACTEKEWLDNNEEILNRVGAKTYLRGLLKLLRDNLGCYRNGVPAGITAEDWAKIIVLNCVRNTELENLHAGMEPPSKVVTPDGEIEWNNLSRISDEEMKMLMVSFVNNVFTVLSLPPHQLALRPAPEEWNQPEIVEGMTMKAIVEALEQDGIDSAEIRKMADLPKP